MSVGDISSRHLPIIALGMSVRFPKLTTTPLSVASPIQPENCGFNEAAASTFDDTPPKYKFPYSSLIGAAGAGDLFTTHLCF